MPESKGPGEGASIPEPSTPSLGLLYRRFFEHAPLEVHIWQVVRDTRQAIVNWRLVDANPAALTSWGRRLEEVLGRTVDEIFPQADAVRSFLPVVDAIMASGQPRQWEMPFGATGQVLRMVSVPLGDCFVSTGVDVTAEHARQQELEHALQQVTQATQAGGVGLWDWDLRTQAVRFPTNGSGNSAMRRTRSPTRSKSGGRGSIPTISARRSRPRRLPWTIRRSPTTSPSGCVTATARTAG
jgi:hypothetical protein